MASLSAVDYRWAASRGFYNLRKRRWVKDKGGLSGYLLQRKTPKSRRGGAAPVERRLTSSADCGWALEGRGGAPGFGFHVPPELWIKTDLFGMPV
jgi:hypothetical protein